MRIYYVYMQSIYDGVCVVKITVYSQYMQTKSLSTPLTTLL